MDVCMVYDSVDFILTCQIHLESNTVFRCGVSGLANKFDTGV